MKSSLVWLVIFVSLRNVSSMLKVLDDPETACAGLICDYSFITWKEKIEILQANNDLRNTIADGYSADIATAAINKLAWSEKLSVLAQDQANKCPETKVWTHTDPNGQCEYASMKRVRKFLRLQKNFSFINENRMMDFDSDSFDGTKKLRRASAYTIGCGYVLRYHKEKLVDQFVCLYCYVNSKYDYISFNGNRSCQQDCLYENFTCDSVYNRLCSYEGKDGYIDATHKSNTLCPKVNLLTATMLFGNFLTNSVTCLVGAIFVVTAVILGTGLAVHFAVKNYDRWRMFVSGKGTVDGESPVHSTSDSVVQPKLTTTTTTTTTTTPPPPTPSPFAVCVGSAESAASVDVIENDVPPTLSSVKPNESAACSLASQNLTDVGHLKWPLHQEFANAKGTGIRGVGGDAPNDTESNTKTEISGRKENELTATTRRVASHEMTAQGKRSSTRGVADADKKRISAPLEGRLDNGGSSKRRKLATLVQPQMAERQHRGRGVDRKKRDDYEKLPKLPGRRQTMETHRRQ